MRPSRHHKENGQACWYQTSEPAVPVCSVQHTSDIEAPGRRRRQRARPGPANSGRGAAQASTQPAVHALGGYLCRSRLSERRMATLPIMVIAAVGTGLIIVIVIIVLAVIGLLTVIRGRR